MSLSVQQTTNFQTVAVRITKLPHHSRIASTTIKLISKPIERPHEKYGSAIYVKPDLVITSTSMTENNDIEILTVNIGSITITSV